MVDGLSAFNRRFAAVPVKVREAAKTAMEAQAADIVAEMKVRAPYDDGDLQGSINWTWGAAPAGSLTIGTVEGRQYGGLKITIYAGGGDAFHARFQEFGTVDMWANPFFFSTWRGKKRKVRSAITRAINKAIKNA